MQRDPPNEQPPAYTLPTRLVQRTSLRPVWGIIYAAATLRRRNDYDLSGSIDTIYLVLAILYFICAGLEAFGFFAAWRGSIKLVKSYFWASASVALIVTGAELLRVVTHYTEKDAIQKGCRDSYADDISKGTYTSATIEEYCSDAWRNASYVDIALLIFSFFISFLFASLAASYLHQLKNPQLLRTHAAPINGAASNAYAYPLAPYPQSAAPYGAPYAMPPPPPGYAPGQPLPTYDNPYGVSASDDKAPVTPSALGGYPAAQNPFADQVEHSTLVRREGETAEEFEQRQHEADQAAERRRAAESTETVTLGGGGGRVL
ncbi:hypothetical protein JCM10207_006111 [Rhodosporidiobolus poonsookiae]